VQQAACRLTPISLALNAAEGNIYTDHLDPVGRPAHQGILRAHRRSSTVGKTDCRPSFSGIAKPGCAWDVIDSEAVGWRQIS
jgi:hypothetical protein